jgi:hypothetical protein
MADALYFGRISEAECATAPSRDARRPWNEYSDEQLAGLDAAMAHQEADGFVYYLPAYLCAAVRRLQRDDLDRWSDLVSHAVFQVTDTSDYSRMRFRRLSAAQRAAVVKFLEYAEQHADPSVADQAYKSLDRYWKNPNQDPPRIVLP